MITRDVINSFQHLTQKGKNSLHHCFKVDRQIYSSWIINHITAEAQHSTSEDPGSSTSTSASSSSNPARLELVHTDLCGPMDESSFGGKHYLLTFIDDCTRRARACFLQAKSETLQCFQYFKAETEKRTGLSIKGLRHDRGGEYTSNVFKALCLQRVASFKILQKLIHLSRIEWLREPTGRWLRWQDQWCTIIIYLYHSGQRPSGQQPTSGTDVQQADWAL